MSVYNSSNTDDNMSMNNNSNTDDNISMHNNGNTDDNISMNNNSTANNDNTSDDNAYTIIKHNRFQPNSKYFTVEPYLGHFLSDIIPSDCTLPRFRRCTLSSRCHGRFSRWNHLWITAFPFLVINI